MALVRGTGGDTAILLWLVSALDHAREQGNTKLVDYLQTVADDVVFEAEMAARRASMLARLG